MAAVALTCAAAGLLSATAAHSTVTTINPIADAYVDSSKPTTNFGTALLLQQDSASSSQMVSYLQFQVQGLSGSPASAILHLSSEVSGATPTKVLAVSSNTWTETGITYNNRPATGTVVGQTGALVVGDVSVDVTSAITGNGVYSFALTNGATAVRKIDSREAGAKAPHLDITGAVTTTSTAPTSSTPTTSASSTPTTSTASTSTASTSTASTASTSTASTSTASSTSSPPSQSDPVIALGGDIACAVADPNYNGGNGVATACHMKNTAAQITAMKPVALLPLGDEQYNSGNLTDFQTSYAQSWGVNPLLAITHSVVGNHEYGTSGAGGYFKYFGLHAGSSTCTSGCPGYYSFNIGQWHIVAINTECTRINGGTGCAVGSPQEQWLKADLAASSSKCTLVFGHRPRWSSNSFASPDIAPLISDMYAAGVDIYASGHSHAYERFQPQNPSGAVDTSKGITQLVVGTGGSFYTGFGTILANSVTHKSNLFGVMKMTLHATSADYKFLPENSTFTDSGTVTCH